jgi:hypothetical protein
LRVAMTTATGAGDAGMGCNIAQGRSHKTDRT